MKVTPIAHTTFHTFPASVSPSYFTGRALQSNAHDAWLTNADIDTLHEFAGRACYQSWHMPNEKTATNEGYMANVIGQGHESVLEHGSVTFYIEGVSRALTHELIRHRHLSFSELSRRYVDAGEAKFIDPPLMRGIDGFGIEGSVVADEFRANYEELVERLAEAAPKATRKQVREAARAVMPNATETKIVVTGNLRAWRDVLKKRWHVAADAEIRELAGEILGHLRTIAPNSVADIPEEPYE